MLARLDHAQLQAMMFCSLSCGKGHLAQSYIARAGGVCDQSTPLPQPGTPRGWHSLRSSSSLRSAHLAPGNGPAIPPR